MKKLSLMMIVSVVILSACSTPHVLKSRQNNYVTATALPPLQVPAGVSRDALGTDYPVSGTINTNGQVPSLVPPGSLAASGTK
jgi:uncharacterized lipoprotein